MRMQEIIQKPSFSGCEDMSLFQENIVLSELGNEWLPQVANGGKLIKILTNV